MARRSVGGLGEAEVVLERPTPGDLFELGLKYCIGQDVCADLVEAHKWFNLAALRGNVEARQCRTEISVDMPKSDVFKAQRLARQWLRSSDGLARC